MQAVEATNEAEQLVHKSALDAEAELIVPITGYIVILPENYMLVHGQETWQGASVSIKYQDHSSWSDDFLVEMLQYFFNMAKAISFPQLDEFAWRMDKVETFWNTYCMVTACPTTPFMSFCNALDSGLSSVSCRGCADQRQQVALVCHCLQVATCDNHASELHSKLPLVGPS